jgi:hypothetical protein
MHHYDHDPDAQKWVHEMMHSPDKWEQWRYLDSIKVYTSIIDELEEQYMLLPDDLSNANVRMRCQVQLARAYSGLKTILAEHEKFKERQKRTAISK